MRNQYDDHIRHNKQIRLDSIAVRPVFYILTGEKQGSYGADPGYSSLILILDLPLDFSFFEEEREVLPEVLLSFIPAAVPG